MAVTCCRAVAAGVASGYLSDRTSTAVTPAERDMRRNQRLRAARDFAAVYANGRPVRGDSLILRAVSNGRDVSRFGFTTAKVLGNAVLRNRLRKRLKAAASSLRVAGGWDVVVNARRGAVDQDYERLREQLRRLLDRGKVSLETQAI